jgi:MFS family permease
MGVYAAMSVAGSSVGLLAGGLLVAYADWRWVLFVNVPIGIAVAVTARFVLSPGTGTGAGAGTGITTARRSGRQVGFDLPGTITGTAGVAALVYGLSNAATGPNGTSHWGDAKVVVALAASVVLLAAFALIESRSRHALLPLRLLRNRDRLGAYLMMLGVGTAIAGVFFFLTLFVQEVWGYSALRTGVAFLPVTAAMLVGAIGATALVPRIGARPVLVAGSAVTVGGLYWLSLMTSTGTYLGDLLGAGLILGIGFGLLIVPLQLLALTRVPDADSGAAASLLNAGRQVGGAIGLAVLGTVGWTVVADNARGHAGGGAVGAVGSVASAAYRHALVVGFDRAFLVGAGIAVLILLVAVTMIRIRRADLAGS